MLPFWDLQVRFTHSFKKCWSLRPPPPHSLEIFIDPPLVGLSVWIFSGTTHSYSCFLKAIFIFLGGSRNSGFHCNCPSWIFITLILLLLLLLLILVVIAVAAACHCGHHRHRHRHHLSISVSLQTGSLARACKKRKKEKFASKVSPAWPGDRTSVGHDLLASLTYSRSLRLQFQLKKISLESLFAGYISLHTSRCILGQKVLIL